MSETAWSFLLIAKEDLSASRMLAPALPRHAAFHAQQAAEKLLKAILTVEKIGFGRHHDLAVLTDQLPDEIPMRRDFRILSRFTPYATEHRYQAPHAGTPPAAPEPDDLRLGLEDLENLLAEVEAWLAKRAPHIPR